MYISYKLKTESHSLVIGNVISCSYDKNHTHLHVRYGFHHRMDLPLENLDWFTVITEEKYI